MTGRRKKVKWEFVGLNALVLLFVVALLGYTFVHTGAVLARHIEPAVLGYVAAFGIEGLIIVLSWRRAFRRSATQSVSWTLAIVLSISAIANLYEGYAVKYGQELTWQLLLELDPFQALVWVMVTLVVPFLVFVAGDVVGSGVEAFGKYITTLTEDQPKQKRRTATQPIAEPKPKPAEPEQQSHECEFCGATFLNPQGVAAHKRFCHAYKEHKAKQKEQT